MEATTILPIVAVLSLVTVEYGGWALLTFLSGRAGLADWQKGFFRAGHAHAGVLLLLSLVYLLYLPRAEFSDSFEWIAGGVLCPLYGTKLTRAVRSLDRRQPRRTGCGTDPDGLVSCGSKASLWRSKTPCRDRRGRRARRPFLGRHPRTRDARVPSPLLSSEASGRARRGRWPLRRSLR
jgi:hypothetical protein